MERRRHAFPAGEASRPSFKERRTERMPVDEPASLRPGSWYSVEVRVRDVSTRGFMAECSEAVEIGSNVSLEVPGVGEVHAQVRWQIGPCMGGMFRDPISLERCEWVATRAEVAPVA
jgi:hypothetical protein